MSEEKETSENAKAGGRLQATGKEIGPGAHWMRRRHHDNLWPFVCTETRRVSLCRFWKVHSWIRWGFQVGQ